MIYIMIISVIIYFLCIGIIAYHADDSGIVPIALFTIPVVSMLFFIASIIMNADSLKESLVKDNKIEYRINKTTGESYIHLNDSTMVNTFKLINKEEK